MIPLLKKMLKISLENCFRTQYMKKLFTFILLGLFSCSSVYACGGDFYTGLFDFSKEHKICGKYARSMDEDDFQKNDKILFRFYKRTLTSNFLSYYHLHFNNNSNRRVIFFGNWPPLLKINGKTVLYLHNKLLLTKELDYVLNLPTKLRLIMLRNIINLFKKNIFTFG